MRKVCSLSVWLSGDRRTWPAARPPPLSAAILAECVDAAREAFGDHYIRRMPRAVRAAAPNLDDFAGFPAEALRFLRALARHNAREWFETERGRYESAVLAPMRALVEETDARLATFAPELVGSPKRSIFRIHRDIRFSNDKTPYKTHAACLFYHRDVGGAGAAGRTMQAAGFYFQIQPRNSFIGGGVWMPPAQTLKLLRASILDDPDALARILQAPSFRRVFGTLDAEGMLVRYPRGITAETPGAELLRYRSFTAWRPLDDADLASPALADRLEEAMRALLPLIRWANAALGLKPADRR